MIKFNETFLQKTLVVWLGALVCCALWGSAFPCIKIGYALMDISSSDVATQIYYAGIRFTLAGVLAIVLGSITSRTFIVPSAKALPKVAALSLFQTVLQYLFFYVGLAHASGVNASIIEGLNVFVAIFIAGILFRMEKVTIKKIVGCVIGFSGVVFITLSGGSVGAISFLGEGFVFFSTIAYALSSVLLKRFSKTENAVMLSGYQFLLGGLFMTIVGRIFGGHFTVVNNESMYMLLYLAFVSAIAYTIWGTLLKYNPVSKVAVFGFMNPVFGVILSTLLLNETDAFSLGAIISLALVCAGIYICNK